MVAPPYARWFQFGLCFIAGHVAIAAYGTPSIASELTHDSFPRAVPSLKAHEYGLVAQILPDNTLKNEGSIVIDTNTGRTIDGGAIRGPNLFHSFQEFNVNTDQQVYFVNPDGIETILSRITGNTISTIDGLLGVAGPADLFLINPNGVIFGPNAQLDIRGSFAVSTANTIQFANGSLFSTVNPNSSAFLTASVPLGVQFGTVPQGDISNTGILATGADLTLLGKQLYLEGELIAGNDLTLQAQDTVTIRDNITNPFIAQAGNDLTVQGNTGIDIFTLQHLEQTPFVSGGNLILISDGDISGDAHFDSGGDVQFLTVTGQPGNFVSLHDPIIFANGDVTFGDYEGVALKVEATGSIQAGKIRIIGPDTTLTADGSGSDEDLLASSTALIFRAGVQSVNGSKLPLSTGGTTFREQPVTNQPPGNIVVTSIDTTSVIDGGDGGPIILAADGNITTNPDLEPGFINLDSFSRTSSDNDGDAGKGGDISITSISGDILLNGRLSSFSQTLGNGNAGTGGNILVSSESGNIIANDRINSFSLSQRNTQGNASNAGNITFSTISGEITTNERFNAFSSAFDGDSTRGGDITISSQSGNIQIIEDLETFAEAFEGEAGDGGNIVVISETGNIEALDQIESFSIARREGNSGNGGNISISTNSGNIRTTDFVRSFSFVRSPMGGTAGNGGNISLSTTSGNITTEGRLSSFASTRSELITGGAGDAGNIVITTVSGDIAVNRIDSSSTFFPFDPEQIFTELTAATGNGGDITITSVSGDITNEGFIVSESSSRNGDVGRGGDIVITTQEGSIRSKADELISTIAVSEVDGNTGAGGTVTLQAPTISNVEIATISSGDASGDVTIRGVGDNAVISNLKVITSGQLVVVNPSINDSESDETGQTIILDSSTFDRSGTTVITGDGDLTLNNIEILSDANRSADAGDLEIVSAGELRINNSRLFSNANPGSSGNGGSVRVTSADSITLDGTVINNQTDGSGRAGNIRFRTPLLLIQNGSQVTAATSSPNPQGSGGDISIEADTVNLSGDNTTVSVSTSGPAVAGSITLTPVTQDGNLEIVTINDGPQFSASTASGSSARGGDIFIQNADIVFLRNTDLVTSSDGSGNAGNIVVEDVNVLLMRQGSLIQAGASANGDGGSIDIDAGLVLTVVGEDNDILADTTSGTGGDIKITTERIIGFREVDTFSNDLRGNGFNDISARSEQGVDGEVTIDNFSIDPNQGVTALPTDVIDPTNQIAQGCNLENNAVAETPSGDLIITGRGGQLPSPQDLTSTDISFDDLGPTNMTPTDIEAHVTSIEDGPGPKAIEDAQDAIVTPSGDVFLIAAGNWQTSLSCRSLR